jgi:hypothetical protein
MPDTAHSDRVLVPFGVNGYAVYQIARNGNAVFKQSLLRGEMESDYARRFWAIETLEEGQTVARLLRRRFPEVFGSLSEIFEQADPLDVVYPGNPNEYSDVIREIIVLLAPMEGKIGLLTPSQVEELVKEGLGRCFDDEPIERRVQDVVSMITARFQGFTV